MNNAHDTGDATRPLHLADVADPDDAATTPAEPTTVLPVAETQALPRSGDTSVMPAATTSVLPPTETTLPLTEASAGTTPAGTGAGASATPAGTGPSPTPAATSPIIQPIAPATQPAQATPHASATAPAGTNPAQPADPRSQAWQQQGDAARGYAGEAARNGYPGWNGYQPPASPSGTASDTAPAQPADPRPDPGPSYKGGVSIGTIVLGVVLLVVGVYGVALFLFPGLFITARLWSVILAALLALAGVALVIGAVATALRRQRHAPRTGSHR